MDLFTSTPLKSDGKSELLHFSSEGCLHYKVEKNSAHQDGPQGGNEDLDHLSRSLEEADFAASFQSRSLDPSLYTTYSDLSSFIPESLDDDTPVPDHDPELVVSSLIAADARRSFDAKSLSLLKSKIVNRSLESILSELEQIFKNLDKNSPTQDGDFKSAPQQISLSADSVWSGSREGEALNQSANNLARENKLTASSGLNGNTLVSKDDRSIPDSELTEQTRYVDSSLTDRAGEESAGRCSYNGITPASRAVTNHAASHNVSQTHGKGISQYSDVTHTASISNVGLQYNTAASTGQFDNGNSLGKPTTVNIVEECIVRSDICEQLESSVQPPASSLARGDAVGFKMASNLKEKRNGKPGKGKTVATESDLMTVIEALRREAASWEEKYRELKQRRGSRSEDSKDYVVELKSRNAKEVVEELQSLIRDAEGNLVDAKEEIEELKEEIDDLKLELEEAADRVREGDLEEFRDLKHDLDQVTKECRILQYRLRKSDRKLEQVEQEKSELEAKLKLLLETPVSIPPSGDTTTSGDASQSGSGKASAASSNAGTSDEEDKAMEKEIANLKQQLKVAKDVSVRLHQELELIEEKRARTEEDNQLLRGRLMDSESARKDLKRDLEKSKLEAGNVKTHRFVCLQYNG